jgi:hypothetical protein
MPDNKIWSGGKLVGVLVSILFGSRMSRWSETEARCRLR